MRWTFAAIHLLGLGIGLGAVWARARALGALRDTAFDVAAIRRVLVADAWWGIAALVWISTGLMRAFGGIEKGSAYYLHNQLFWAKMALLGLVLVLEIRPMVTFGRWREQVGRRQSVDTGVAAGIARTSYVQVVLVILMVVAATGMARGYGG